MFGWHGRILEIDLTSRRLREVTPDRELYRRWIGGRGLAGWYLAPHIKRRWDDPEMPLLLFTGPLADTPTPGSSQACIMSRSPLTGTVGDGSVGGNLGAAVKRAGWDGVIVTGASDTLCGIEIAGDSCSVRDAEQMRGMRTDVVHEMLGSAGACMTIGPAAENGVAFSTIVVDRHCAGVRNGLGRIMAAKGLKYLTVRGETATHVHDPAELSHAREDILRLIAASPILLGELGIGTFGTGALYDLMATRRMLPTANFRRTVFEDATSMNAYAYRQRYAPEKHGCGDCVVQCGKTAADGRPIPEFETMSHFSALVENHDLETVVRVNELCDQLGMDPVSTAATVACHLEIGDSRLEDDELLNLVTDIAYGRGIGAELASGSAAFAVAKGVPDSSMSVKRQELPAYDPRGAYGMALGYAVSTRGGCHLRAYPISHEILRKPVATDRFTFAGKARLTRISEDTNAAIDSLAACKLICLGVTLEEYARAFAAVTGEKVNAHDLLQVGERISYHERIMNAANGFSAADDDLPGRFFTEDGSSGQGIEVHRIDRADFLAARANYYRVRGLDENGLPTETKTRELGLSWSS